MKKILLYPFALLFLPPASAQSVLSLEAAVSQACSTSPAARLADNLRLNKTHQYAMFEADLKPRLTLRAGLPTYSRDYFEVRQPDGGILFLPRAQNTAQVGLSLLQILPRTGGVLSMNSSLTRFDDFARRGTSYTGSPLNLSLEQPLFAFNPYRWSQKIEPLKYEEAKKAFESDLRGIARATATLYFDVLEALERLRTATGAQASIQLLRETEQARIPLGTTSREKLLQIELQELRATQSRQEAEVDVQNARVALFSYLGVPDAEDTGFLLPETVPEQVVDIEAALQHARENRAEYPASRRRQLEAARDAEQARRGRTAVQLVVSLGWNGAGARPADLFSSLADQQRVSVGIGLPLLDWGRQKAQIGIADANEKGVAYALEQERRDIETRIYHQVKTQELLRANTGYARRASAIADERFLLALEQYRSGELGLSDIARALEEKELFRRTYIHALRRFWEGHYALLQTTLREP